MSNPLLWEIVSKTSDGNTAMENMSDQHERCRYVCCSWRITASLCRSLAETVASVIRSLGRFLRRILSRRRHREYVRDDRAGVELVSVQQLSRTPTTRVDQCSRQIPATVDVDDCPREVRSLHRSRNPRYPTLLAISKALDELERTQTFATTVENEKKEDCNDIDDKSEELPKYEETESTTSTHSKDREKEGEKPYDWDMWSVESLEWNFDDNSDDDTAISGSSQNYG